MDKILTGQDTINFLKKTQENEINLKYKNLQIEDVNVWATTEGSFSIDIDWICQGKGFGTIRIGKHDEHYYLDDEYMDKEFVMKVFEKLYDKCKEEENV